MPWYRQLHWQIIIGLILGLIYGIIAAAQGWTEFTADWIKPWGEIFLSGLMLVAVPLVLVSLILGVASLSDLKKLSRIGGKTLGFYVLSTPVAVLLGLVMVNVLQPGGYVAPDIQAELYEVYSQDVGSRQEVAESVSAQGPLRFIEDIVPRNFFASVHDNRNMLQVVFMALLFGVGLVQIPRNVAQPMIDVLEAANQVIIKLVNVVMLIAPFGVFALLGSAITEITGDDPSRIMSIVGALGMYMATVIAALGVHLFVFYGSVLKVGAPTNTLEWLKGMFPAQLVAFSTSSSAATLPVTMECCEKNLGIDEEIVSFSIPLGATVNMDGTALYQAVAAVFIAQAVGIDLTLAQQMIIVLTAVLASIGTAAVPGAGIVMLIIILESVGIPLAGIALILGVDRILDMLRTVVNISGDAVVTSVVAHSEGQISESSTS